MSQNIGTLISSSIRPNDSLDLIASAFANEVKGGLHTATSSSDRDLIMSVRREWGMMCYVVNDDKLYQLKYNFVDININNNANWSLFNSSSGGGSGEWLDSVFMRIGTPPGTPFDKDRYLLLSIGNIGVWTSNPNKVAQWNSATSVWDYTTPLNGMSVRVDNEDNSIYKYEGNYPTGQWNKELISQVRFIGVNSSDNITFTANTTPLIDSYNTEMLFLSVFATSNSGTSSININSLGNVYLKKLSGSGIVDLEANDIVAGYVYDVVYDGTFFQINISSSSLSTGVIGVAESGTYNNGLFTDFVPTTPIGTPIDRFNEILKSLVPPPSPILSNWSGVKSGISVNGKLSFDISNPIAGYINADIAPVNPISVDGLWSVTGKRLGISPFNGGNLSGVLNSQVAVHTGLPTPAYIATSFSDANLGSLKMYINGVLVPSATVNLSALGPYSSGGSTGFTVTAATSSKFPGGDPFDTFMNRTGTWLVLGNDSNLVNGYNYIYITHDNSPSFIRTLTRYEFIVDDNVIPTSITGASITSFLLTGSKLLSGISYYTGGSLNYDVTIDNLYRNTYYPLGDAITFSDQTTGNTIPLLTTSTTLSLAASVGNESKQFKISNPDQNGSSLQFNIISSGKRRINESISMNVGAKRTVQGNTSGGLVSLNNVLLDNVNPTSTLLFESFDDENYRLMNVNGAIQYDLVSDISNIWDSSKSLIGSTPGFSNGLQVTNGTLIYPVTNYSSFGSSTTNINFTNLQTAYNSASGNRVYTRYFRQVTPTTGNFKMVINGSGGSFVSMITSLTGNNIHVEIKAPSQTGWLDAYSDFATAQWSDGNGGRDAASGLGRGFGTNWGLTIGTKNTANTSGYMVVRITVGSSFTGNIDNITWLFV